MEKKYKLPVLIFIIASLLNSLFPPFEWDVKNDTQIKEYSELIKPIPIRSIYKSLRKSLKKSLTINAKNQKNDYDVLSLPTKGRSFLYNDLSKDMFVKWGWDYKNKRSVKKYITVHRQLLVSDLLMNYVIIFLISLLTFVYLDWEKRKSEKHSV